MKMIIQILLPLGLASRIFRVFGKQHDVTALDTGSAFRLDSLLGADVVIVEPLLFLRLMGRALRDVVTTIGPSRIVAYSQPSGASILAAVELARSGVRHIMVAGTADTASELERVVLDVFAGALMERLMRRVGPQLDLLPPPLAQAVIDGMRRPYEYRDVGAVCTAANSPRRSCDRALARAGLTYLSRLLRAARVVRATPLFRDKNLTASTIAAKTGALSERQLAAEVRQVIGTPGTALRKMNDDDVLARVMRYIRTPSNRTLPTEIGTGSS